MSAVDPQAQLWRVLRTRRVLAVAVLSLSSGLPLGFVVRSMPQWLAKLGVDIKTIGVLTLVQAPYAFKFLWAPLMDRFAPPLLGRKRGWVLLTQLSLAACMFLLAWGAARLSDGGDTTALVAAIAGLTLLLAFTSATQDIALDGYAVEVLEANEQAAASGARSLLYRLAMWISGNAVISLGPIWGWSWSLLALGGLFLALVPVTLAAEEPRSPPRPVGSLKDALWLPLVGFLGRPQALQIAAFLFLYKMADNLAESLITPFLTQRGYGEWDVGVGRGVTILLAASAGTFVGSWATVRWGLVRALWVFGVVQALSNLGYAALAALPVARPWLYGATAIEYFTSGLGTASFGLLTMRLTERRFSATQFALLTSVWALGRVLSGPPAGALAASVGWAWFFVLTLPAALPGLWLLRRSEHLAEAAPTEEALGAGPRAPWDRATLVRRGVAWGAAAAVLGVGVAALLGALKGLRERHTLDLLGALDAVLRPASAAGSLDLLGALAFGVFAGLAVAAGMAARGRNVS